jgi:RHS repeat-associated protein
MLTMQRNGSTGNSIDDFNYSYYSGTNKLSKVTGSVNQYTYDANGNMTRDDLDKNFDIIYDHRNLIIQLKQMIIDIHGSRNDTTIYHTFYYYDEAGNRIRKKVYNDENDSLLKDIVYSRDLNGKEMAIYENGSIKQWNIWGMENAGFITGEGDKRYYLKDHLGSIRAVIDDGGSLISAQDYDAWGYQLQDRSYNSEESIYKFTSKERDNENKYDYFGARYYDARIGRWGQTDPHFENFIDLSPFAYVVNNPNRFYDNKGKDIDPLSIYFHDENFYNELISNIKETTGLELNIVNGKWNILSESANGSSIAREFLKTAITNPDIQITLDILLEGSSTGSYSTAKNVYLNKQQILEFTSGVSDGLNPNTNNAGMVLLHELYHTEASVTSIHNCRI